MTFCIAVDKLLFSFWLQVMWIVCGMV